MSEAAGPRRLEFFLDFVSHNTYLAWTQLRPLAFRHGLEVVPVPVLFAAMLENNGQLGPAEIPPKSRWMLHNVLRKARALGVPMRPPASHPFNPLVALRAAGLEMPEGERERLIDALFAAAWAEAEDLSRPEVVAAAARRAGLDGEALVARAGEPEAKERLRAATDEAIGRGVFGVPTMIVDGELFWGLDDFHWLECRLEGDDPVAGMDLSEWYAVTPSTRRRGGPGREP